MFLPSNITLQFGDSGDFVAELQRRLAQVDCFNADAISGFYDGATVNGVTAFQSRNGIRADGIAGPETLRRLNGAISGDSSTSSDSKKDEEAAKQVSGSTMALQQQWIEQHPPIIETVQTASANASLSAAAAVPMNSSAPQPVNPITAEPNMAAQTLQQQMAATQQAAQPVDILAQMLLDRPVLQPPSATQNLGMENRPSLQSPVDLQQLSSNSALNAAAAGNDKSTLSGDGKREHAQAPSMLQKVREFGSAMLQKLNDYFEAKLPASVLREVQEAGQVMAKGGVKEAPIPTGPELGGRGAELPSRGPEQQQAQQRN